MAAQADNPALLNDTKPVRALDEVMFALMIAATPNVCKLAE